MTILILSILFKWIGYDKMEKALYRTRLLIDKKEEERENIEEKLHKQAECLCRKPLKKIKTNDKK